MTREFLLLVLCAVLLSSCGKNDSTTAAEPELTPEELAKMEADFIMPTQQQTGSWKSKRPGRVPETKTGPSAPAQVQQRLQGAIHGPLTLQLRMFIEKNGRIPESFTEFMYRTTDSAPPAPPGMKFVIDPADKTVKAVKKQE